VYKAPRGKPPYGNKLFCLELLREQPGGDRRGTAGGEIKKGGVPGENRYL
jgi:hypothetical protein